MAKTSRGCPRCGSNETWGLGKSGVQSCDGCDYRWIPCGDQYCQGYRLHFEGTVPRITGCPDCDAEHGGVRTEVVMWWPSAWRAVARRLDERKKDEDSDDGPVPKITS